MVMIKFKKLVESAHAPTQANPGDAGWDVRASQDTVLPPATVTAVGTGLAFEVPDGYELQVRSKSGIALKEGFSIANGIGTIDSGYRGELFVLLRNHNNFTKVIRTHEMVAQIVLNQLPVMEMKESSELSESVRGKKGLGSTPTKAVINETPATTNKK